MVTQSILPFKLETTHERITSAAHNLEFIKDYEAQTLPSKFFECPYVGHLPYL